LQITLGAFGGPGLNSFAEHLPHLPLLPQIVWAILAAGSELLGAGIVSLDALIFRRGLWAIGPQPLQGAKRRTP
jgi:hypothetical protein